MKYYYLLILFLFSTTCYSQDSLKYYNDNINNRLKKNDLNGSFNYFKKKLNYLKKQDNLEEYFYAHFDYFMSNAVAERVSVLTNSDINKWREPVTNDEKIAKLHVLINIAYHLKTFSSISKSVTAYENALYFYENKNIRQYNIVEYCLTPLANNYMRLGDYTRAEEILKNTINITELQNNKKQLIKTYINLSNLYNLTHNYKKANILLQNLLINIKTDKQQSKIYTKIANNYYELNDVKNAIKYINKSTKLYTNLNTDLKNIILKGLIFYKNKQYQNAEKQFKIALTSSKSIFKKNDREIAKLQLLIAETNLKLNEPKIALEHYQNVLVAMLPKFKPKDKFENPQTENLYAENTLLDAFEGKATVFKLLNKNQLAINNLKLANTIANLLRNTFTTQNSKIIQQTKNRKRTEKIVDLYYNLYTKTNDKQYITEAFYSIEKSRALVLNTNLQTRNNNQKFVNDSLFILKEKLENQKTILTKNILVEEFKAKNANVAYIKNQIAIKTKLTTKLHWLNEQINNKYPFLNTINNFSTVTEIQNKLLIKNQILITYFETKNQWLVFSLTKETDLKLRILPKNELLNNNTNNYINFFFNEHDDLLKNNVNSYQKTAYYLYQKLVQPELKELYEYITIIPDNKLNFLAFDALLTKPTTSINFKNYPYLIKNHAINISFSTNILTIQKENILESNLKKAIGYFPVFKNKERELQTLLYTLKEQKQFDNYTNGNSYIKEKATKKHFLDNYKNYNLIHLATHASAGNFEQPAQIEFYDETLYLPEIYGLNMQTDLLVLSACETGVGKIQKGEGLMSLARGFTYAGVKNLVVSLWKVNDKATSELMANFYKNLTQNSKIKALQIAKLDYLKNDKISNFKKSPYYWSSFVFVGNVELVSTTNNYWYYLIIIGILLLIILVYFSVKKRHE